MQPTAIRLGHQGGGVVAVRVGLQFRELGEDAQVYVAYTALFAATAAFYLAAGRLFGIFWVGLAVAMLAVTRYVYRGSRPGQFGSREDQPH